MFIPAPERFVDLRVFLHEAEIDTTYLGLKLEQYLKLPDNMPKHDWHTDPTDDHQAWAYREAVQQFRQMLIEKPDEGNGDN